MYDTGSPELEMLLRGETVPVIWLLHAPMDRSVMQQLLISRMPFFPNCRRLRSFLIFWVYFSRSWMWNIHFHSEHEATQASEPNYCFCQGGCGGVLLMITFGTLCNLTFVERKCETVCSRVACFPAMILFSCIHAVRNTQNLCGCLWQGHLQVSGFHGVIVIRLSVHAQWRLTRGHELPLNLEVWHLACDRAADNNRCWANGAEGKVPGNSVWRKTRQMERQKLSPRCSLWCASLVLSTSVTPSLHFAN